MSTLTVNRQRKAQQIAEVLDTALFRQGVLTIPGQDRQQFVLSWLDNLDAELWVQISCALGFVDPPSSECQAIVRTILEERYSVEDPFEGFGI